MGRFGTITRVNKLTYAKVEYHYSWIITGFFTSAYIGESPRFFTGQDNQYEWALCIYTNGYGTDYRDYVSIRLHLYHVEKHNDIKFTCEASVVDEKGEKHITKRVFLSEKTVNTAEGAIKDFILKSQLSADKPKLLPKGDLRILCEISFDDYIDREVSSEAIRVQRSHDKEAMDYFAKLLNNDKFSDFTLVVGGNEFHVHRAILSARSRVFETMFTSDMRESRDGKTIIEDVDADVMAKLLHFVYVGRVDDINDEMAKKLIVAADKYEVVALKQVCEDVLIKQLKVENVYEVFLLADTYNANKIKTKAIEFLRVNSKILSAAEDFEANIRSLPTALQTDIICSFMANF